MYFSDSFDFSVRDGENERKFCFTALNTIYEARERAVFEDTTFHLSASVLPSLDVLRRLIEAAGGVVERERPTLKQIAEYIQVRCDKLQLLVQTQSFAVR